MWPFKGNGNINQKIQNTVLFSVSKKRIFISGFLWKFQFHSCYIHSVVNIWLGWALIRITPSATAITNQISSFCVFKVIPFFILKFPVLCDIHGSEYTLAYFNLYVTCTSMFSWRILMSIVSDLPSPYIYRLLYMPC